MISAASVAGSWPKIVLVPLTRSGPDVPMMTAGMAVSTTSLPSPPW